MNLLRTLILPKDAADKSLVHNAFKYYLQKQPTVHLYTIIGDGETERKLVEKTDKRIRKVENDLLADALANGTTAEISEFFWVVWARSLENVQELLDDTNLVTDTNNLVPDWSNILSFTLAKTTQNDQPRNIANAMERPESLTPVVANADSPPVGGNESVQPSTEGRPKKIFNPHITRKMHLVISPNTVSGS